MSPELAETKLGKFVVAAIEQSGRQPLFFGQPLSAGEAGSPMGALPVFFLQVRELARILDGKNETPWLDGLHLESDPETLLGVGLRINHIPETGLNPVLALFYESLNIAISLSPDSDTVELSHLVKAIPPDVLKALEITSWPNKIEETPLMKFPGM